MVETAASTGSPSRYEEVVAGLVAAGEITDPASARGKLLRAATELFRRLGYERTTVRDLAREIGIQSGSIFHHFRSKQDILHAVMEENIRISTARLEAAQAGHREPRDRLHAIACAELESINGASQDALSVLVFEWRCLDDASRRKLLDLRAGYERIWIDALSALRPDLPGEEIFVLRRLLAGAVSWTHTWYRRDGRLDLDALAERIVRMAGVTETAS